MQALEPYAHTSAESMLRMGLAPITDTECLAPFSTATWQRFHRHKVSQLAADPDAVLADDCALPALLELQSRLAENLRRHHANALKDNAIDLDSCGQLDAVDLLTRISLWLPDDVCILQAPESLAVDGAEGDYLLTAASVLSPSHWHPNEKFMRPLSIIHRPIPGFTEQLTPRVSRFFQHIKPGQPVVRYNWGIQPGDQLNWQTASEPVVTADTPLYYRSERQTLMRLPDTQAVVFFIRITQWPLTELNDSSHHPGLLAELLAHMDALPARERAYKGIDRLQAALAKYRRASPC